MDEKEHKEFSENHLKIGAEVVKVLNKILDDYEHVNGPLILHSIMTSVAGIIYTLSPTHTLAEELMQRAIKSMKEAQLRNMQNREEEKK